MILFFLAASTIGLAQTYLGVYGTAGIATDADQSQLLPLSGGGGVLGRWSIDSKWFLAGEASFRSIRVTDYPFSKRQPEWDERWVYNQTSVPVWAGYYLSKPQAKARFWLGIGLGFENCVDSYRGFNQDPFPSAWLARALFLQNYLGLDIYLKRTVLSFQATVSPLVAYHTRYWDYTRFPHEPGDKGRLYKDQGFGLHYLPLSQSQLRFQALVPINTKKNLLALLATDALLRATDPGGYDPEWVIETWPYAYLGLNVGVVYRFE